MFRDATFAWSLFRIGAGLVCLIALIRPSGTLGESRIAALVVLGAIFFSIGVYGLGRLRVPVAFATLPRTIVILSAIWGGMISEGYKVRPISPPPTLIIAGYEVILFKREQPPLANVLFENVGGEGTITVYSHGALALTSADPFEKKKELQEFDRQLVSQGGGLAFRLRHGVTRWLAISGPPLTPEDIDGLKHGKYAFYFSGTILASGGQSPYEFCSFVVGTNTHEVLRCPDK
jgi:hypothetical protein